MTDEPFLPRYLIRQGTSGLMVWDRHAKGPAKLNGQPAIGLTEEQAVKIKEQLTSSSAADG
jgi:hypothetical protein